MSAKLTEIRNELDRQEAWRLSSFATKSAEALREREEKNLITGHRQWFSVDTDRILHSLSYTRYIDKTQVFSLIPNDHLTHRVLHVQLVSKIARTIGRFLRLNEDLIEAIALGHDIGHPPFGHDGERYLSDLCVEHGLPPFLHSVQGVHFLRIVERKGRGANLSLQVLDGILCHDGELHRRSISPDNNKSFETLDREIDRKQLDPSVDLRPMSLEGCVVRMSDVISYIGRDIEDAIRLKLISRSDIPTVPRKVLGETNGSIVYTLVEDLITESLDRNEIAFSSGVADALAELRDFNFEKIYRDPRIKTEAARIKTLFRILFERFLEDIEGERYDSVIFGNFLDGMSEGYRSELKPAEIVRDFMAGMTDEYLLRTGRELLMPKTLPPSF